MQETVRITNVPSEEVAKLYPCFLTSGTYVETKDGEMVYFSGTTQKDGKINVNEVEYDVPKGCILVDQQGRGGGREIFTILSLDQFSHSSS